MSVHTNTHFDDCTLNKTRELRLALKWRAMNTNTLLTFVRSKEHTSHEQHFLVCMIHYKPCNACTLDSPKLHGRKLHTQSSKASAVICKVSFTFLQAIDMKFALACSTLQPPLSRTWSHTRRTFIIARKDFMTHKCLSFELHKDRRTMQILSVAGGCGNSQAAPSWLCRIFRSPFTLWGGGGRERERERPMLLESTTLSTTRRLLFLAEEFNNGVVDFPNDKSFRTNGTDVSQSGKNGSSDTQFSSTCADIIDEVSAGPKKRARLGNTSIGNETVVVVTSSIHNSTALRQIEVRTGGLFIFWLPKTLGRKPQQTNRTTQKNKFYLIGWEHLGCACKKHSVANCVRCLGEDASFSKCRRKMSNPPTLNRRWSFLQYISRSFKLWYTQRVDSNPAQLVVARNKKILRPQRGHCSYPKPWGAQSQ